MLKVYGLERRVEVEGGRYGLGRAIVEEESEEE